jgi:C-terminal processing protease CtpA/Prc
MRRARVVLAVLAAAAAGAAAGAGCTAAQIAQAVNNALQDCSVGGQNATVRSTLRDIYYWYRELPDPDPKSFTSPEAYLEAVRYKPLDTHYSFIAPRAATQQFFNEGQDVGLGLPYRIVSSTEMRVVDTYPGSPAGDAGIERGAYILEVNGQPIASVIASGNISAAFGPKEAGVTVSLRFRDMSGVEHAVTMTKRVFTLPNVYQVRTFASGGRAVGYFAFHDFINPSNAQLDAVFSQFKAAGVNDLVLDLRYNGGGLITVAQRLGGLIGGARTQDQPIGMLVFNDKHQEMNQTFKMANPPQALGLDRLAVIATGGSASASEMIINGLRPFMPVTVVGSTTYGKPVGQLTTDFCDKTLFPVAFKSVNARGEGEYFDGIPADCSAPDDLDHALGDGAEASLAAALEFLRTGRCSARAAAAARAESARHPAAGPVVPDGGGRPIMIPR